MDQSLVNTLTLQVIDYIVSTVMEPVHGIIDAKVDDEAVAKDIKDAIDEHLKKVSGAIPKKAPTATRRSGGSSSSAGVIKDADGNDIKCEQPTKKGTPCKNWARHDIEGKKVCAVHSKTLTNAQPDSNAKPKKKAPTAPKAGASTFVQAVSAANTSFSKTNLADDDVDDIGDEF